MLSDTLNKKFNDVSHREINICKRVYIKTLKSLSAFKMQLLKQIKSSCALHRVLKFRTRYFVTKSNTPRMRYVVPVFGVFAFSALLITNFSSSGQTKFTTSAEAKKEYVQAELKTTEPQTVLQRALPDNLIDLMRIAPDQSKKRNNATRTVEIKSGQTIAGILQDKGVPGNDAYQTVKALSEFLDPRKIKPGQSFKMRTKSSDDHESVVLAEFSMDVDSIKSVHIERDGDEYKAEIREKEVEKRTYAGSTQIQTSLYGSAARSGIPPQVIAKMIRMYSWSVDFQRDIRRNDEIELLYDVYETEDGDAVKYGDILYANLNVSGINIPLYRFENSHGNVDYYDVRGHSIKKTLMRTPVDGARMSSGYGMRRHPILGYNKMHKGVDFAAPLGTPIYAAGDGVIDRIGRNGGYGNYIRIRHNNSLKTAYAHLHKFGKGMSKGKRVKQGQIIGYVGSTGRSTGPHLHYEVLLNGKQVNPNRVDLPVGERLKGKDLENFKRQIEKYNDMYAERSKNKKYAYRDDKEEKKKKAS